MIRLKVFNRIWMRTLIRVLETAKQYPSLSFSLIGKDNACCHLSEDYSIISLLKTPLIPADNEEHFFQSHCILEIEGAESESAVSKLLDFNEFYSFEVFKILRDEQ